MQVKASVRSWGVIFFGSAWLEFVLLMLWKCARPVSAGERMWTFVMLGVFED